MPKIILTTLNAKYGHASFGLRYLMANLGDLAPRAAMLEFDINQRPVDIVEAILKGRRPAELGVHVFREGVHLGGVGMIVSTGCHRCGTRGLAPIMSICGNGVR